MTSRQIRIHNLRICIKFALLASHGGQSLLITVVFLLLASAALLASFSSIGMRETRSSRIDSRAKQSYFLAEAGAEDVAWRIRNNKRYSASQNVFLDGAVAAVKVIDSGSEKTIESKAETGGAIREVNLILAAGSGASFVYGLQIGRGGLEMENTSRVEGSVYSNGPIAGTGHPVVTGDAFAAGTSPITDMAVQGHAHAALIQDSAIGKNASSTGDISDSAVDFNAHANRILSSTIGLDAYYQTAISGSTVGGQIFSGVTAPEALPELPLSVSDSILDTWQAEAEAGGTISSPCPYKPVDGSSIGPVKIACDLEISGTKQITMAGPVWVLGNFSIKNSAQLKLASSFGSYSSAMVVNNPSDQITSSKISVENSSTIVGSGTPGSYIMATSRNRSSELGGNETAIDIKNSSNAAIYYAPHGEISVQNNNSLKEAAAYKIHIGNGATVNYESGLANINFSSGPTGGWNIRGWTEER